MYRIVLRRPGMSTQEQVGTATDRPKTEAIAQQHALDTMSVMMPRELS